MAQNSWNLGVSLTRSFGFNTWLGEEDTEDMRRSGVVVGFGCQCGALEKIS